MGRCYTFSSCRGRCRGGVLGVKEAWTHPEIHSIKGHKIQQLRDTHGPLKPSSPPLPSDFIPSPNSTSCQAELILTLNNFSFNFNSTHFLQVRGVANGYLHGPQLCLSLHETNFDKGASEMATFFLNQGFPSTVVDRALNQ
eukprot:g29041.t1